MTRIIGTTWLGFKNKKNTWAVKFKEKSLAHARAALVQKFARTNSRTFYSYKFTLIYILIAILV